MNKILAILFILSSISCNAQWYGLNRNYPLDSCDISPISYSGNSFDISNESGNGQGVEISQNGEELFVADLTVDSIFQYTLSVPYIVESASYTGSFYVGSIFGNISDLFIRDDGLKMFCIGLTSRRVYPFTLTSANDLSTMTYDGFYFTLAPKVIDAYSLDFSKDGTNMYINDIRVDSTYQYTLTAWDISTATYTNKSLYVKKASNTTKIRLCGNGSVLYVKDGLNTFFTFNFGVDWDLSTATAGAETGGVSSFTSFDVNSTNKIIVGMSNVQDSVYLYEY